MSWPAVLRRRLQRTPLGVKLAWLSAMLTAVVVAVTFVAVSGGVRSRTRTLFTSELRNSRRALVEIQQRDLGQLLTGARVIAKSASLIAAVKTAQFDVDSSASRNDQLATTFEIELRRLVAEFEPDVAIVADAEGRVFASAARERVTGDTASSVASDGPSAPRRGADLSDMLAVRRALDDAAAVDTGQLAVLRVGRLSYQVGVFPIVQGGYTAGVVLFGRRLDSVFVAEARQLTGGDVLVVAGDEVIAGTRTSLTGDELARLTVGGPSDSSSAIALGGEEVAVAGLSLGTMPGGAPVHLWLLQPFGAAVEAATRPLFIALALTGIAVILLSGLGAALVARSVMRPFNRFVDYLAAGTAPDRVASRFPMRFHAGHGSPEVETLDATFTRLMDSLSSEQRQLERRTTDLIAANAGLREEVRERERVELALRESEAQLRQSQKLEAIGTLAGGIAHDFNNLLTVISGYSQLALSRTERSGPAADDLRQVIEAADRAARLTHQLLAFSRKQVLQPTVLELGDVVEGLVPMLSPLLGERIEVCIDRGDPFARIFADRGQLEQVLVNLAVNARDAMAGGGTLTIRTAEIAGSSGDLTGVRLEVIDTGTGIPPAIRDRIFEPFFTTKEPGKGTGLGLATVYGIVKQSGGSLTVESDDRGTTFTIVLPLADAMAPSSSVWSTDVPAPRGTETILLVEDEDEVRTLARRTLEAQGYTVIAVGDPAEALAITRSALIDLILTDVVMPGMSGPELVGRMSRAPGPAIVFMSGYADDALPTLELGRGTAAAFLRKPFTPLALARMVRDALDAAHDGGRDARSA